jgi:hypothetical protein
MAAMKKIYTDGCYDMGVKAALLGCSDENKIGRCDRSNYQPNSGLLVFRISAGFPGRNHFGQNG